MTMGGTLPEVFDRVCLYYAERTAIRDGDRAISYRQMQQWANRVANGLGALGVAPGERVGLLLPNVLEFIPTQHGVWKSGAVLVQMPARASAATHRTNLAQSAANSQIYHDQFYNAARESGTGLPNLKTVIRLADATSAGPVVPAGRMTDSVDYRAHFEAQPDT